MTATVTSARDEPVSAWVSRSSSSTRFGSPVNGSWVAKWARSRSRRRRSVDVPGDHRDRLRRARVVQQRGGRHRDINAVTSAMTMDGVQVPHLPAGDDRGQHGGPFGAGAGRVEHAQVASDCFCREVAVEILCALVPGEHGALDVGGEDRVGGRFDNHRERSCGVLRALAFGDVGGQPDDGQQLTVVGEDRRVGDHGRKFGAVPPAHGKVARPAATGRKGHHDLLSLRRGSGRRDQLDD